MGYFGAASTTHPRTSRKTPASNSQTSSHLRAMRSLCVTIREVSPLSRWSSRNNSKYMLAGPMVQVSCRLVSQQQFRHADQRSGDRDALLLSAGDFADFMIQAVRQPHPVQNLARGSLGFGPVIAADQFRHHGVFKRRKLRQKMVELKDKPNIPVAKPSPARGAPHKKMFSPLNNTSPWVGESRPPNR